VAGATITSSVRLGVPAAYAFEFLADPATASVIDPAIRDYRPETLPMDVGTRTRIRMRVWGLPVRAESVVRAWEPGRRMVMENVKPTRPVSVVGTHAFEDEGDSCTYTWTVDVTPVGVVGRVAAPLFARFMGRNVVGQRDRFRREVERRWRSASASD
jgi:hypothetical protein